MWYFTTLRHRGNYTDVVGMYYNANAGDTTKWTYEADTSRPAVSESHTPIAAARPRDHPGDQRNKFNLFWDEQKSGNNCGAGLVDGLARRPRTCSAGEFQRVQQATWTMTATSKLLLEAGRRHLPVGLGRQRARRQQPRPDQDHRTVHRRLRRPTAASPNLSYRGAGELADRVDRRAHLACVGVVCHRRQHHEVRLSGRLPRRRSAVRRGRPASTYRFNNGVPNQLTEFLSPLQDKSRVRYNALYAQDSYTRDRLTVQGAVRYDHSWSFYPEQQIGPTKFLSQAIVFPESKACSATTTSRRGSAWPTTCSATARRR